MSETVALTPGLPGHMRPGLTVAGKYRLEEEIGRGSMGTVYRAVHVTLGTRVAIKLISTEHLQSVEARRRFSIEAKAAAKLRSRHVVQVYDDGETPEGNPYIVLEYLDGETLEQRITREHDVPLTDAVRITSHVGRALARAHAQGIVHRDLKPANVFLVKTDDDEAGWIAKVLDFGIAKLDGHGEKGTTQAGTVLGTPLFMSPEQVRGASSVDHRADLYSLGMCLFHMLTGEFAYYRPNYSDILIGICTEPLPRLRDQAPWVPEAVEQWFQRACAKEPLERFQSADEMTEALAAAAGPPHLSKHKSVPEGRIAPETLMGYAAPALATQHPDSRSSSAGPQGTQLLSGRSGQALGGWNAASGTSPGHGLPGAPPQPLQPLAIEVARERSSRPDADWLPPKRSLKPLLIGVGLGLLAVASVVATGLLLGGGSSASEAAAPPRASAAPHASSARAPAPSPPPALSASEPMPAATALLPAPTVEPAAGSSVAAEPRMKPQRSGSKQSERAPAPPPARPISKSPSSDLGF